MTETLSATLPDDVEAAAHALLEEACRHELMLATAESCTGGLLASVLTDVEGFGHAFERGFVTYTDAAKNALLGVPQSLLAARGAVSREVALAMAEGALKASEAHVALSITGFAGAGAPGDEPGLVHFGVARRGAPTRTEEHHFGDVGRGAVRIECLRTAIRMMGQAL